MGIPILGDIINSVKDIVSEVVVDKDKKNEILARIDERYHEQMMGQLDVNKIEAGHRSVFVAGWRPAIGWVGALSLFMYYPVQVAVQLWTLGAVTLDVSDLLVIIGGLLGFGGLRSFDKVKGTANDVLKLPSLPKLGKVKDPVNILPEDAPWMK